MSRATIVGEIKEQRKYIAEFKRSGERGDIVRLTCGKILQLFDLIFRALLTLMDKEYAE